MQYDWGIYGFCSSFTAFFKTPSSSDKPTKSEKQCWRLEAEACWKGIPDVLSHVILHPSRSSGETKELKST